MSEHEKHSLIDRCTVRTYRPGDQKTVEELYVSGLLVGQIAPNDTGADIENIMEAYFQEARNRFWVADIEGRVLGMIGVAGDAQHVAQIRRLRVHKEWQHTALASKLVETALLHCRHFGYLKVVLDTHFERSAALGMFTRFGFQHTRTRTAGDKELLEFYLDLYRTQKKD